MLYIEIDGVLTNTVATINKILKTNIECIRDYDLYSTRIQKEMFDEKYIQECVPNIDVIEFLKNKNFKCLTSRLSINDLKTKKWLKQYLKRDVEVLYSASKHNILTSADVLLDSKPLTIANCNIEKKKSFLYQNKTLCFEKEIELYKINNIINNELLFLL